MKVNELNNNKHLTSVYRGYPGDTSAPDPDIMFYYLTTRPPFLRLNNTLLRHSEKTEQTKINQPKVNIQIEQHLDPSRCKQWSVHTAPVQKDTSLCTLYILH